MPSKLPSAEMSGNPGVKARHGLNAYEERLRAEAEESTKLTLESEEHHSQRPPRGFRFH